MQDSETREHKLKCDNEQLRQVREKFDQKQEQDRRLFTHDLVMRYAAILLLFTIVILSIIVVSCPKEFSRSTVIAAEVALFADVLGFAIIMWRKLLKSESESEEESSDPEDQY